MDASAQLEPSEECADVGGRVFGGVELHHGARRRTRVDDEIGCLQGRLDKGMGLKGANEMMESST